ncbi:MAG: flagellar FlbD family protein [Actinomycetota bacterium]|nr:flagellar FlbD family protein [Actinomycetota bacterium]
MIELHRLDNTKILINSDLIECIEEIPDTIITLITGNKYIVKEDFKKIVKSIIDFRKKAAYISVSRYKALKKENYDFKKNLKNVEKK